MNFLRFRGTVAAGGRHVRLNGDSIAVPELHESLSDGELALGVRPEHVSLADAGDLRGEVFGVEYMGTMQVVTVNTHHGRIKARVASSVKARIGEDVGLAFRNDRLIVFDTVSGRALRSRLFEEASHG
jgi:multiple sugar transport system ATP-binding protein